MKLNQMPISLLYAGLVIVSLSSPAEVSPYASGGEVTRLDLGNFRTAYVHVFTNTAEAATFANTSNRTLSLRYLVVGAGGAGGTRYSNSTMGGGGGGGGGVCERRDIAFASGASWQIQVGKGATSYAVAAGASSISNGVAEVETVPGGGNGATKDDVATAGAAGGGGHARDADKKIGAAGTYASSLFGIEYGPFSGATIGNTRYGGGGGGAGEAGSGTSGGDGLVSDITGESLVYGSGGGGGCGKNAGSKPPAYYQGGRGGTRAGDGGRFVYERNEDDSITTNSVAATSAAANSGGGGGGAAGTLSNGAGKGADGIVVIRYVISESPCAGGDVITRTELRPGKYRYLHTFTNVTEAATFVNQSGRDLKLRYLVVGAGGSGSSRYATNQMSGGGGGGGGVCEKAGIAFADGASWSVLVGKGASTIYVQSGASSISNGLAAVELVPGGGNAGKAGETPIAPTAGAAGGGGVNESPDGAAGTYDSSILGVSAGGPYSGGSYSKNRTSGGGGGAGGSGLATTSSKAPRDGGVGLVSEITGEPLMYGAGGGGGGTVSSGDIVINGGRGGMGDPRAANGGGWTTETVGEEETRLYYGATKPAANSGNGGAGARHGGETDTATGGADGIVVIRYDYTEIKNGLVVIIW